MAKILIVDDEPRIRELIRENLQYSGYTCEEAGDGSAALSLLTGGGYDLVILDLMMPFMDGMTCLREMRTRRIRRSTRKDLDTLQHYVRVALHTSDPFFEPFQAGSIFIEDS